VIAGTKGRGKENAAPGRILVVEDSPTQAAMVRALLEGAGYQVTLAVNGEEGLARFKDTECDLVISDIVMPGAIDGYELCRRIKATARRETPVALLTSLADPLDIIRGLECGADNFFTKSIEGDVLLERVDLLLATRQSRARSKMHMGVKVFFLGREFTITSEREQILDLLISTFEDAVRQNLELRAREQELEAAKEALSKYAGVLERQLESVLANVPDIIFSLDPDAARLLYVSPASTRVLGVPAEALMGDMENWSATMHPEDRTWVRDWYRRAGQLGTQSTAEYRVVGLDGTVRWIQGTINPCRDETGAVTRIDGVARDVTERRLARERLRSREAELRGIVDSALDAVVAIDESGSITTWNPQAERIFGWPREEAIGRKLATTIIPPQHREAHQRGLSRYLATRESRIIGQRIEMTAMHRDGREFPVELAITSLHTEDGLSFSAFIRDVTERRRLEEQVRLAQKMEAIGTLAGGVAHDFNNLLTVMKVSVELALPALPADSPVRDDLRAIGEATDRAALLTRQLLTFGRKQEVDPQPLRLNDLVTNTTSMLKRIIGEDVRLVVQCTSEPTVVQADLGQLEQVVMNLSVNARDAMAGGGELALLTDTVTIDEAFCSTHPWARPGSYVRLTVSDTGTGMDAETQARIFEPFFTTKPVGRGTGLGLAVVYGIVKQHGGLIHVYSEPGKGTAFRVYLPAYATTAPVEGRIVPGEKLVGGNEAILLTEDDDALRSTSTRILTQLGYKVIAAGNGEEALYALQEQGDRIHLAVLDVVMPGMGGRQLYDEFRPRHPDLRVLFTTGYSPGTSQTESLKALGVEVLPKPYGIRDLALAVRRALDEP
jgi:PAS domain S-box-containing protein